MYKLIILAAIIFASTGALPVSKVRPIGGGLCSFDPTPRYRSGILTYMVATATADTVLAGLGSVTPSTYEGRDDAGDVYGQIVRVDSVAGAGEVEIRHALQQGDRRVVAVPWDYDAGCLPTYRHGSARWVDSGLVGFYVLKLRDESQWVASRPTFDAFTASINPYPHGAFYHSGWRGTDALRSRASLDARELFSFSRTLPFVDAPAGMGPDSLVALRRWMSEHPELAKRYPADVIVRELLALKPRR